MKLSIYQVDAFTNKVFGGNPAAICPLEEWLPDDTLLAIAEENNLSETAFFIKKEDDSFDLRWFTPAVEVDLCGHATVASAFVIFEKLGFTKDKIVFNSKSGELSVTKNDGYYYLDFPSRAPQAFDNIPESFLNGSAFGGIKPQSILKARDCFVVFNSEQEVLDINPDYNLLMDMDTLGIIVTAQGNESDFVSRFFAPRAGIHEDPVTGSAHCTLIPYWANRLNKQKLTAYQVSERRGFVKCELLGDRVKIGGEAMLYLEGEISI